MLYAQSSQPPVPMGPIIHCLRGGTKQSPVKATLKWTCYTEIVWLLIEIWIVKTGGCEIKTNFKIMAEMQLLENSISPPLYFADILHYWVISARFYLFLKSTSFGPHNCKWLVWKISWLLQHWSNSTNLGLNLKSRSQTHHSYTINWLKWNLVYASNIKYLSNL